MITDHVYEYGGYEVGSGGPISCKVCGEDVAKHARTGASTPAAPAPTKEEVARLVDEMERNKWCLVPPSQECEQWCVFERFDGEFGCDDLIGTGKTVSLALKSAINEKRRTK